ncbi:MAG: SDR family NAD(P)-dependent oxidoreductase, partial [Betaproteobacteria bacterium]|nr:SDR family NAD(P)-dependent oxidoreductase [Betaproteobacteria bacterium]
MQGLQQGLAVQAALGHVFPHGPGASAYAASKAGVIAFSKCIAIEWAPAIRVN